MYFSYFCRVKDQLHTAQELYRDNIGPMKSLKRGIQDRIDEVCIRDMFFTPVLVFSWEK